MLTASSPLPSSLIFPSLSSPLGLLSSSSSSLHLISPLFTSFPPLPPLSHTPCRVIFHVCHLQDVTPEQRVSLSLSAEDLWALDFIFSAYLPRRLFSFFLLMQVTWQFGVIFKSLPHKHSYIIALCFSPLAGCHRLREEEICFCHMLICSELPVEADRYLFPCSHRESDGDCFYVFISLTPSDELSQPHMENFCSDMVHKKMKTTVFGSAAAWITIGGDSFSGQSW